MLAELQRLVAVIAMFLAVTGCAPLVANFSEARNLDPQKLEKLAVLVVDSTITSSRQMRTPNPIVAQVEDLFLRGLIARGYRMVSRTDNQFLLAEIKFQQSGATEAGAAELGRMLNIPAVVIVRINEHANWSEMVRVKYQDGSTKSVREYRARTTIAARLVSVEQAEVLWASSQTESGRVNDSTGTMAGEAARKVVAAFPYRELPTDKDGNRYDPRLKRP